MRSTRLRPIEVVGIGENELEPALLADLSARLAACLGVGTWLGEPLPWDVLSVVGQGTLPGKERLSSNDLVDALIERSANGPGAEEEVWTIGVTGRDLRAPRRSFVFGEAALGGRWAVVSVARFGAPGAPSPRLRDRLLKETLHEIAHLAGLEHCPDPRCPASPAQRVREIDHKTREFCARCLRQLFPATET